jgi:hypothetical protein
MNSYFWSSPTHPALYGSCSQSNSLAFVHTYIRAVSSVCQKLIIVFTFRGSTCPSSATRKFCTTSTFTSTFSASTTSLARCKVVHSQTVTVRGMLTTAAKGILLSSPSRLSGRTCLSSWYIGSYGDLVITHDFDLHVGSRNVLMFDIVSIRLGIA